MIEYEGIWIETASGKRFELSNPVYDINDIAYSLSNICRFTGHCKRFYSVAEHSMLVARIMQYFEMGDPLEGLLHDSVESVIGDLNSPIKSLLTDYKELESYLDVAMRSQFNLPLRMAQPCKTADLVALCIEAKALVMSGGQNWPCFADPIKEMAEAYPDNAKPTFANFIESDYWVIKFMQAYRQLTGQRQ